MTDKLIKYIKKIYPKFGLRKGDVLLASYPKSGNTWLRFIWMNIVSMKEGNGELITFQNINDKYGSTYDIHSYGDFKFKSLPRLVKTHKSCQDFFRDFDSVLLVRNPGDVMISYYEYLLGLNVIGEELSVGEFIRNNDYGIKHWCHHTKSWFNKSTMIIRYEDMKVDAYACVKKILKEIGIEQYDDSIIKEAINRSSFNSMKRIEKEKGLPALKNQDIKKEYNFVRKGLVGEWRSYLIDSDINFINDQIKNYGLEGLYLL